MGNLVKTWRHLIRFIQDIPVILRESAQRQRLDALECEYVDRVRDGMPAAWAEKRYQGSHAIADFVGALGGEDPVEASAFRDAIRSGIRITTQDILDNTPEGAKLIAATGITMGNEPRSSRDDR